MSTTSIAPDMNTLSASSTNNLGLHTLFRLVCPSILNPFNINSLTPLTKIAEFANSVDLDEVAHNEPPHLDLHCLLPSL